MILPAIVFLPLIFALFQERLQSVLRMLVARRPVLVFGGPAVLCAAFYAIAAVAGALTLPLAVAMFAYALIPALLVFPRRPVLDFAAIGALWLPLEFALGKNLVPRPTQGLLHAAAYGVAVTLALWLFLIYRSLPGMKYRFPSGGRDFAIPVAAWAMLAVILIPLALRLRFMAPFHIPAALSIQFVATRFAVIFAATALPEEILFRSLIQNRLTQILGDRVCVVALASVIFGAAHLNNGPGRLPNWRYMILATIAGFAYGLVFKKSSSVCSSAILHAMVNTTRHVFF